MINNETIESILEYAIRAPSTHNSQPWLFKIKKDQVDVFFEPKYVLPFADKEGRDLYISIGCMIENFKIASCNFGIKPTISYGPFEEKTKLAEILLVEDPEVASNELYKKLFPIMPKRVNARGEFNKEEISTDLINKIKNLVDKENIDVSFMTDKKNIERIATLTGEAVTEAHNESGFRKEMSNWMNSNLSSKKEGLPGYSLKMPLLISIFVPILIRYFNIGFFLSKLNIKTINSAPLVIVFSGENNPNSWIQVGILAERMMLFLQSLGYQTSIYVASIEIGERYKEIQRMIGSKYRPQFMFTTGHIEGEHKVTPRHNLKDKIII